MRWFYSNLKAVEVYQTSYPGEVDNDKPSEIFCEMQMCTELKTALVHKIPETTAEEFKSFIEHDDNRYIYYYILYIYVLSQVLVLSLKFLDWEEVVIIIGN